VALVDNPSDSVLSLYCDGAITPSRMARVGILREEILRKRKHDKIS
jgi:hypothetical protein